MNRKAKFQLLLLVAIIAICGYLAVIFNRARSPLPPFLAAQKTFDEEATTHDRRGEYREAALSYDQTIILCENAYKRLNGLHGLDVEKAKETGGRILYLKSKAMRDKHYALAAAAGKPLPETVDSVTGEAYRNILNIPDVRDRDEAAASLRGAATQFDLGDFDIHFDALRMALMMNPIQWDQIERHSKAILAVKPQDSRAKFMLAKFEFEQPDSRSNRPMPLDKRSRERVKTAQKLIDDVHSDPKFPVWRTEYLRASIYQFLAKNPEKKHSIESEILEQMLLDPVTGALARLRLGEGFDHLGIWDSEGILGLYAMSAEIAMDKLHRRSPDSKGPIKVPAKRDDSEFVRAYVELLSFCESKFQKNDPAFGRSILAASLLKTMIRGQSVLGLPHAKEWHQGLDLLRAMLKEEFAADRCDPQRVAQFVELLVRETSLVPRRGGTAQEVDQLRAEAKGWLDEGFAFAGRHKLNEVQAMPLNLLAANLCYLSGAKRAEVAPYLTALRRTGLSTATATALMIDGSYDEREGRLLRARDKIEQAVKTPGGDEEIRGHAALANIYLAIGRPDYALLSLYYLKKILSDYDDFNTQEREWLSMFVGSPQNYQALTVVASLENARRSVAAAALKNSAAKVPPEVGKDDEDRVKSLLSRDLPITSVPGFVARTAWIHHLTVTNRRKDAEDQWQELNIHYPDRVELLTLKIGIMEREAADSGDAAKKKSLPGDVDKVIQAFIKAYPENQSAQIAYATWLAQTKRTDQALESLKDIVDRSGISPELRRVAAAIVLTIQTETSPIALARHLPRNPQIDRVLFDLGRGAAPRNEVKNALARHEMTGLSRIMEADDLYLAGQFAKAAEAFVEAFDFTRVKAFAEQGFLRSVFQLANLDSDAALVLVERVVGELPNEHTPLLAYSYVMLVRDNIGMPTDEWMVRQTMASALNVWELRVSNPATENQVAIALTKAEFWFRANRVDVALDQARRALKHDPKHAVALATCASMMLDDPAHDARPELRELLTNLSQVAPNSLLTLRLQGRAMENAQSWDDAVGYYERALAVAPLDRETYSRLVNVLDQRGDPAGALKWIKEWRGKLPNDSQAVAAEVRILTRGKQLAKAVSVADEFIKYTESVGLKRAELVKDQAGKVRVVEEAKWLPQVELARGFYLANAFDEAERRLTKMPKPYGDVPLARELLSEIYLRTNQWAKAEAILDEIVKKSPRHFQAVNNLAYLLAVKTKNPARAREVILAATKTEAMPLSLRATDRLPIQLLNTIGVVYTTLGDVKDGDQKYGRELLQFFSAAAVRYPNDPRVDFYMGYGYELIGENARARDLYERAVKKSAHPALSNDERNTLLTDVAVCRDRVEAKLKVPSR